MPGFEVAEQVQLLPTNQYSFSVYCLVWTEASSYVDIGCFPIDNTSNKDITWQLPCHHTTIEFVILLYRTSPPPHQARCIHPPSNQPTPILAYLSQPNPAPSLKLPPKTRGVKLTGPKKPDPRHPNPEFKPLQRSATCILLSI